MKKPYYVTFKLMPPFTHRVPRVDMDISMDIEVGRLHGARIIVQKIKEEIETYLYTEYGISGAAFKITGIFKL